MIFDVLQEWKPVSGQKQLCSVLESQNCNVPSISASQAAVEPWRASHAGGKFMNGPLYSLKCTCRTYEIILCDPARQHFWLRGPYVSEGTVSTHYVEAAHPGSWKTGGLKQTLVFS